MMKKKPLSEMILWNFKHCSRVCETDRERKNAECNAWTDFFPSLLFNKIFQRRKKIASKCFVCLEEIHTHEHTTVWRIWVFCKTKRKKKKWIENVLFLHFFNWIWSEAHISYDFCIIVNHRFRLAEWGKWAQRFKKELSTRKKGKRKEKKKTHT